MNTLCDPNRDLRDASKSFFFSFSEKGLGICVFFGLNLEAANL